MGTEEIQELAMAVAACLTDGTLGKLLGDGDRLGYPEHEAASLIGVESWVLRDARLRGEISARKVGRRVIYDREALLAYLRTLPTEKKTRKPKKAKVAID